MNLFRLGQLCLLCHEPIQKTLALCDDCEKILPWSNNLIANYTAHFNKAVILFDYTFPVDQLVTQLKFQHQLANAKLLGKLLASKLIQIYQHTPLPSLLIPVPLHPKRLSERGFNQSLEIAKPISKNLNIPIEKNLCTRTRHTIAQSALSQQGRLKNLKNAFGCKTILPVSHIALIDDVITTGETLKELAFILRKNGAEHIDVWCCAQTLPYY